MSTSTQETARRETTVNLDADTIAKLRALLKVASRGPLEPFLNTFLKGLVEDEPFTGCLFDPDDPCCPVPQSKRPETKERILRIIAGGRRLVHSEPLARNAVVYRHHMARIVKAASMQEDGPGVGSIINSLLAYGLDHLECGRIEITPTQPAEAEA